MGCIAFREGVFKCKSGKKVLVWIFLMSSVLVPYISFGWMLYATKGYYGVKETTSSIVLVIYIVLSMMLVLVAGVIIFGKGFTRLDAVKTDMIMKIVNIPGVFVSLGMFFYFTIDDNGTLEEYVQMFILIFVGGLMYCHLTNIAFSTICCVKAMKEGILTLLEFIIYLILSSMPAVVFFSSGIFYLMKKDKYKEEQYDTRVSQENREENR